MGFKEAYDDFLKCHVQKKRKGERLRRLQEGHGHAEKLFFIEGVWWPSFGHFNHLHPEYEVFDFKDGFRYLDFAYIRPSFRVAMEIDGFGPHMRNSNRWQFSDQWQRQNHLVIDGWHILRFSHDDVKEKNPGTASRLSNSLWEGGLGKKIRLRKPLVWKRKC